jgi:hypothetical protein
MTSTAKTLLFWIIVLLACVLLYQTVQHGSSGLALSSPKTVPVKNITVMRLGFAEMVMIFVVALLVFAPVVADRKRFNALTATFNKTFFLALTVILALFTLAELWLFGPSHWRLQQF